MKKPKAYSYIRFSSDAQSKGDSLRRQMENSTEYAKRHGLELVPENMMRDEGLSGFTGKNVSDGALGQFIRAVEEGKIEAGSYLLVESHDRLSRMEASIALELFLRIVNRNVIVVTMEDKQEYRKPVNHMNLFASIIKMQTAHEESAKKRFRGLDNWKTKRRNAGFKKMTALCPAWLALSSDKTTYIVVPERAAIVERIFDTSLSGLGASIIAKRLNREGVAAFRGKLWSPSSIKKILNNRAVLGEYHHHRMENGKRLPTGEVQFGYFPAIITEDQFYANQAALSRRRILVNGRKGKTCSNLFTGLAHCAECGSNMHFTNKGRRNGGVNLVCSGALKGVCNSSRGWPYHLFEESFLSFVREIDVATIINDGVGSRAAVITTEISQLEGRRTDIEKRINQLLDLMDVVGMDVVKQRLAKDKERLAEIEKRMRLLDQERLEIQDSRQRSRTADFQRFPKDLGGEKLFSARAKVAEQIRSVVESIHLSKPDGAIAARLKEAMKAATTNNERRFWQHCHAVYSEPRNIDSKFLVRFKGGGSRLVFPDSKEPQEAWMVANMDFDKLRYEDGSLPSATKTSQELRVEAGLIDP